MRALQFLAVAILIQVGAPQQQPNELTLDVMTIPPPQPKEEAAGYRSGCGCATGKAAHGPGAPLKITLVSVSPEAFARADEIVFELLVEHVGQYPIPIAITRDPDVAPSCRMAEGDVTTSFALLVKGTSELIAAGPELFGSLAAAGTTMTLNPGERLRVRVPAKGDIYRQSPLLEDPQPLQVEALFSTYTFSTYTQGKCLGDGERSGNALAVQVSRPR
jgi:hypothetical protein